MKDSSKYAVAINFWDALCLMFIYLKLTEQITWKWLWITCPVWLQFALGLVLAIIKGFIEAKKGKKNNDC